MAPSLPCGHRFSKVWGGSASTLIAALLLAGPASAEQPQRPGDHDRSAAHGRPTARHSHAAPVSRPAPHDEGKTLLGGVTDLLPRGDVEPVVRGITGVTRKVVHRVVDRVVDRVVEAVPSPAVSITVPRPSVPSGLPVHVPMPESPTPVAPRPSVPTPVVSAPAVAKPVQPATAAPTVASAVTTPTDVGSHPLPLVVAVDEPAPAAAPEAQRQSGRESVAPRRVRAGAPRTAASPSASPSTAAAVLPARVALARSGIFDQPFRPDSPAAVLTCVVVFCGVGTALVVRMGSRGRRT